MRDRVPAQGRLRALLHGPAQEARRGSLASWSPAGPRAHDSDMHVRLLHVQGVLKIHRVCAQVLDWSAAIGRALNFLHCRDVVHRDLKPLNLLLTKHLEIKVSDFGISRLIANRTGEGYSMTGGVGSWRYMAPEVVRHQAYDEKAPDASAQSNYMVLVSSFNGLHQVEDCLCPGR